MTAASRRRLRLSWSTGSPSRLRGEFRAPCAGSQHPPAL